MQLPHLYYLIELNIAHATPNPLHHPALFFEPAHFILSSFDISAPQCDLVDVGDSLIDPPFYRHFVVMRNHLLVPHFVKVKC